MVGLFSSEKDKSVMNHFHRFICEVTEEIYAHKPHYSLFSFHGREWIAKINYGKKILNFSVGSWVVHLVFSRKEMSVSVLLLVRQYSFVIGNTVQLGKES